MICGSSKPYEGTILCLGKGGVFIHNKCIHYAGNPYWLDTNKIKKTKQNTYSVTNQR